MQTASTNYEFPRIFNAILDTYLPQNTISETMSKPYKDIEGYTLNGWSILFLVLGFLMNIDTTKILTILVVLMLLGEIVMDTSTKNTKQVVGSFIIVIIGYAIASFIFRQKMLYVAIAKSPVEAIKSVSPIPKGSSPKGSSPKGSRSSLKRSAGASPKGSSPKGSSPKGSRSSPKRSSQKRTASRK